MIELENGGEHGAPAGIRHHSSGMLLSVSGGKSALRAEGDGNIAGSECANMENMRLARVRSAQI